MRPLVLGGFAGSGKSTVGALVARRLGAPFADTDELVARRAGKPVQEAFRALGEGAFRAMEREELLGAVDRGGVVAAGGGALLARDLRHEVLERATVITLRADARTLASRVTPGTRPLLDAPDVARRVEELLDTRRDAYAECHFRIDTASRTPEQVAAEIAGVADDDSIAVPLGARTHRYAIVMDAPGRLAAAVDALGPSGVVFVTDARVNRARRAYLDRVVRALRAPLIATVVLSEGELHKNAGAAGVIWDAALGAGVDRRGVVVALGGGVVGDLAGFAASTLLRGLRWVQAPTTSLAMADASIGGKTGFDHATGKNRVGTIHQPSAIVADLAHLETLGARHRAAGYAEIVKLALATDRSFLAALGEALDAPTLARAALGKIRIVRVDENEDGARVVLNLGHTVGHAVEAHGRYERFLHGEAVSLGLMAELAATERMGLTRPGVVAAAREALERHGLPVVIDRATLEGALHHVWGDKKRVGRTLSLPVVHDVGSWSVERVDVAAFERAVLG